MLRETVGHLRDLPRYRQILATLLRYGYRDVVVALHLEGLVRPLEKAALGDVPPQERPRRLRLVCEDLGPTFVKLGQLMSNRPDLLPPEYTAELARLRDEVRPFPFEEAEQILTEELDRPIAEVFSSIEPVPVASASISQVHRAVLADGRIVALKIRRPGIEKVVRADLDILSNLAQLAERRIAAIASYQPMLLVREFERSMKRELDLSIERRTIQRCQQQLARDPHAYIPAVYPEYSTSRVLCMEFIDGVPIDDLEAIHLLPADPRVLAQRGASLLLSQVFRFGFFHADPHPGNLRVLPGGVIAPLDYGMFGQIDATTRERIADLLLGLLAVDTDRVLRALDALDIRGAEVDTRGLARDVGELVSAYSDLTLDNIDLGRLLSELLSLVRGHHLRIPPDLILLIRSLVTIESVGRHLDPHFDIASAIHPFVHELAMKRYQPYRLLSQVVRSGEDLQRIATLVPPLLSQSLESIKRGELHVRFDVQHFEQLVDRLSRASYTLAAGIIISGLIISSSLIVRSGVGPVNLGYLGYTAAGILGFWLLANILRGR